MDLDFLTFILKNKIGASQEDIESLYNPSNHALAAWYFVVYVIVSAHFTMYRTQNEACYPVCDVIGNTKEDSHSQEIHPKQKKWCLITQSYLIVLDFWLLYIIVWLCV